MADTLSTTHGSVNNEYWYGCFTHAFIGVDSLRRASAGHGGSGSNSKTDGVALWLHNAAWTVAALENYDAPAAQNVILQLM